MTFDGQGGSGDGPGSRSQGGVAERRGRRRRLGVIVALVVAFLAIGATLSLREQSAADDEAAAMRERLEAAASRVEPAQVAEAVHQALLGDYTAADGLLPEDGLVDTQADLHEIRARYRTPDHRPHRCFTLVLRSERSTVIGGDTC